MHSLYLSLSIALNIEIYVFDQPNESEKRNWLKKKKKRIEIVQVNTL